MAHRSHRPEKLTDHSRVAYVERHDNQRGDTAAAFLQRAHAWFCAHGVAVERVHRYNHHRPHRGIKVPCHD